jgi:Domain of unknown function (DUF222)/HNH endonuclease
MFVRPNEELAKGPGDDAPAAGRNLERVPLERLEHEITELASHIYAGTCRWLELIAEFDRREGWGSWGCRSCVEWISWRCAVGPRAAREHVRVAHRLADLPRIHSAFSRGELSYAKVRALTRVAESDTEAELLELAGYATAAQLERLVRAYRRVTTKEANEVHADRYLTWHWDEDGSFCIHGRLAPEDGAVVLRALEAERDRLQEAGRDDEGGSGEPQASFPGAPGGSAEPIQRPAPQPANADALVGMAEASLAGAGNSRSGGDRTQVVVHVEAETLKGHAHGRCELDDGVAIAPKTARRLACDSSIVSIVESNGSPLSVGRKRRTIPPAVRRALHARDRTCRFPGCENTRFVDAHHLRHWARGGETKLDNLLLLCRHHHRLVHERGFAVQALPGGQIRFRRPDGATIEHLPRAPRGDHHELVRRHAHAGAAMGADTCWTGTGEPMHLGMAVDRVIQICG